MTSASYASLRGPNGIMFSIEPVRMPSARRRAASTPVALGEVVVDRDEVRAAAGERVQVERLGGDERLALAGLHLGDVALVEDDAAHQLHVEEADADRALERLAHRGERLEEELVEVLAVLDPLLELDRLRGELGVGQLLEVGLERADVLRLLQQALAAPALAEAEDLFEADRAAGP